MADLYLGSYNHSLYEAIETGTRVHNMIVDIISPRTVPFTRKASEVRHVRNLTGSCCSVEKMDEAEREAAYVYEPLDVHGRIVESITV